MSVVCLWSPVWWIDEASSPTRPQLPAEHPPAPDGELRRRQTGRPDREVRGRPTDREARNPGAAHRSDRDTPGGAGAEPSHDHAPAGQGRPGTGDRDALVSAFLELAPRVKVEDRGVVWVDARGMDAPALARALIARAAGLGHVDVSAGIAPIPIAAELAAKTVCQARTVGQGTDGDTIVVVDDPARFLAPLPLALLEPDERVLDLLDGVGVTTCGELAALAREAVEVRFGEEGVRCWRLARGDDPRRLFGPIPRLLPQASVDFVEYVLTDPARLVFAANALLGNVCEALAGRGEHARRLRLRLTLANGEVWQRTLRAARPTASRETWLRRIRDRLERLTVPDAIAGIHLEVEATEDAAARQGDLFDLGFSSAGAVEAALERLIESYGPVLVEPERNAHLVAERRTRWNSRDPAAAASHLPAGTSPDRERNGAGAPERARAPGASAPAGPASNSRITLQLLPEPRPITVETAGRRDHRIPIRYRDRGARHTIVTAAGPDRISGDRWGDAFAREYFRCVTDEGVLVWIYRDCRRGEWFLHGWWD